MDPYLALFGDYVNELRIARQDAVRWWNTLLERELAAWQDPTLAYHALRQRWPMGPATHPRVLAVYRKYYLAVDAVNQGLVLEDPLPLADPLEADSWRSDDEGIAIQHPRSVLYERLDEDHPDLARFMDALVFAPIGADRDGRLQ